MLGTSSLGAIITVADTKGTVKGYVQNPGVDIKNRDWRSAGRTIRWKWRIPRHYRLWNWKSLSFYDSACVR